MQTIDDLISTDEVLRITGRSDPSTVSRWVSTGRLPIAKRVGLGKRSAMLFWRDDAERLAGELRQELLGELAKLDAARDAS